MLVSLDKVLPGERECLKMKLLKFAMLAATVTCIGVGASAQARPNHRHQVCTVKIVHHHKVKNCYWR